MKLRQWSRASLEWLIDSGALGSYTESGRFVEPPPQNKFSLDRDRRQLAHYSVANGALYRDQGQWRDAFVLVRSFTSEWSSNRTMPWWKVEPPFGPLEGIPPDEALNELHSAMTALGFPSIDRNSSAGMALFRAEDSCLVKDLPEPYGKWFQMRERRARWDQPEELAVEARVRAIPSGTTATALRFEVSALMPPLILDLLVALRRTPRLRALYGARGKRELAAALAPGVSGWLQSARR